MFITTSSFSISQNTRNGFKIFVIALLVSVSGNRLVVAKDVYKISAASAKEHSFASVQHEEGVATVHLGSSTGIGKATLTRDGKKWPEKITLKLNLKGLEFFELSAGETSQIISLSSHDQEAPARQSLSGKLKTHDQKMKQVDLEAIDKKSPYWAKVTRFPPDCHRAPEAAYVEIELSKALLDTSAETISIEWIDFYR